LNVPFKSKIEIRKTVITLVEDANEAEYPGFGDKLILCVNNMVASINNVDDIITASSMVCFDNVHLLNKTLLNFVMSVTLNSFLIK